MAKSSAAPKPSPRPSPKPRVAAKPQSGAKRTPKRTEPEPVPERAPVRPSAVKPTAAQTILQRSVCLTLERHYLGNKRKVDLDDIVSSSGGESFQLDDRQFHATKKLIDAKEIAPVRSVQNEARAYLRQVAVSTHEVFGERSYLVPLERVEEVDAKLTELQAKLRDRAVELSLRYEMAVEHQRAALGPMFKSSDYVTPEAVVESFSIDWAYVSFAAPERLETVSHALAINAQRKHTKRLSDAFDVVIASLRRSALDIMNDLVDRLQPVDRNGKKKVLRSAALDDLRTFAERLPSRNMTDDAELSAVVERVTALAKGLDVDRLKDSDADRQRLLDAAEAAKTALAGLVADAPRRSMSLAGLDS